MNHENLALKQLADAGVYVFAYIFNPVPIVGATGSIGSPIAMQFSIFSDLPPKLAMLLFHVAPM